MSPLQREMRYTHNNSSIERVTDIMHKNSIIESEPISEYGKQFNTRERDPSKEIAHRNFRLKSHSTIDRLNTMYEDDVKVLDCETSLDNPKKRHTLIKIL